MPCYDGRESEDREQDRIARGVACKLWKLTGCPLLYQMLDTVERRWLEDHIKHDGTYDREA